MPLLSSGVFVIAEENPEASFFKVLKAYGLVCGSYDQVPRLCKEWIERGREEREKRSREIKEKIESEFTMAQGFKGWAKKIRK
jgi:hypothetical protein